MVQTLLQPQGISLPGKVCRGCKSKSATNLHGASNESAEEHATRQTCVDALAAEHGLASLLTLATPERQSDMQPKRLFLDPNPGQTLMVRCSASIASISLGMVSRSAIARPAGPGGYCSSAACSSTRSCRYARSCAHKMRTAQPMLPAC